MIQNCEKNLETNLRDLVSLDTDRNDLEIGTATSWEECLNLVLTNSTRNSSWNGITWVGAGSRKCFAEVHAVKRIEAGCKVDCTSCIFLGKCMNRYFLCWFQIINIYHGNNYKIYSMGNIAFQDWMVQLLQLIQAILKFALNSKLVGHSVLETPII